MTKTMKELREMWRHLNFRYLTYRIHDGDKALMDAFNFLITAQRIEAVLDGKTLDDPLDWAFILAERNAIKQPTNLSEVMVWAENNPKVAVSMAATLDKTKKVLMDLEIGSKKAANLKAWIETQGMDTDKYDEMVMQSGRNYAMQLRAKALFISLQHRKRLVIEDA